MKKLLIVMLSAISFLILGTQVQAEELIRYSNKYETTILSETPTTSDFIDWFNIDLPRGEDNQLIYEVEFQYNDIDFTIPGEYKVSMIFYKSVDNKFQKDFDLILTAPVEKENSPIGDLELKYILRVTVIGVSALITFTTIVCLREFGFKKKKYVIIINNKFDRIIKLRYNLDFDKKIKKVKNKCKINEIQELMLLTKQDIPEYIEQLLKNKKYNFVIIIKN